jgi:hypothetical protein
MVVQRMRRVAKGMQRGPAAAHPWIVSSYPTTLLLGLRRVPLLLAIDFLYWLPYFSISCPPSVIDDRRASC